MVCVSFDGGGQREPERRATAIITVETDAATVRSYDCLANGQSHTHA
jgi:hypothetical protein